MEFICDPSLLGMFASQVPSSFDLRWSIDFQVSANYAILVPVSEPRHTELYSPIRPHFHIFSLVSSSTTIFTWARSRISAALDSRIHRSPGRNLIASPHITSRIKAQPRSIAALESLHSSWHLQSRRIPHLTMLPACCPSYGITIRISGSCH